MPCLLVLVALLLPRLALVLIWLFTDWFAAVFDLWLWPVLGFLFLPYTTLAYMAAILNTGAVTLAWGILIVLAVIVDIGHYDRGYRGRRKRRA